MLSKYLQKTNHDGETEFHKVPELKSSCTSDMFANARFDIILSEARRTIKLDTRNHKILLNNRGTCTVEQFGNLEITRDRYDRIVEWIYDGLESKS